MDRQPAGLSPDGTQIAFTSNRRGDYDIFRKRVSGIEEAELLVGNFGLDVPRGWSPDASLLLAISVGTSTGDDLWVLPRRAAGGGTKPTAKPYLHTEFNERDGRFSPDGRWVAHLSDESGRFATIGRLNARLVSAT